tara:strand:+ start:109 stop:393 length:285 start_codon:yes stop_codon:yes gene_type:complete
MNPDDDEKSLKVSYSYSASQSENEWNYDSREWEYVYTNHTYDYYGTHWDSGPVCKVVWIKEGRKYEKEYSSREQAIEKQKSLLLKKIPAIIKFC